MYDKNWEADYKKKLVSLDEAAKLIKSGDSIMMSAGPSAPVDLMNAIAKRYKELENVTVTSGILMNLLSHLGAEYKGHIKHHTLFLGPLERMFLNQGNIEVTSYQFSKSDEIVFSRYANVALFEVSPPDSRGYMSYGPLGTFNNGLVSRRVEKVIVQVNRKTPFVNGIDAHIHVSKIHYICEADHDLAELPDVPPDQDDHKIAKYIVEQIPDGACIQLGLGKVANAVGFQLESKKDLGVHTEMLTDSMVVLANKGVINCEKKTLDRDKIICGFGIGTRMLYDFMDKNPLISTFPISYICDINNIARIDNFISINNALTIDLTGQVCSETIGYTQYSGTGGQLDFVRGAQLSKGGKSFIALKSVAETKKGKISRITCALPPGTIVTTPRTDVQYVVTEYGIAYLHNESIDQRVKRLVAIAHPDFRDQLMKEAKDAGLLH
ncbi:MAG: acetyl-CoA hydrolase/transferase C-terminal domain-containing protein [Syntrophales bacterium]|jgi:4-hydroxybutyrate CoA-transferase